MIEGRIWRACASIWRTIVVRACVLLVAGCWRMWLCWRMRFAGRWSLVFGLNQSLKKYFAQK